MKFLLCSLVLSALTLSASPINLIVCDNCGWTDGPSNPMGVTYPGPGYPVPLTGTTESFGGDGPGHTGFLSTTIDLSTVFADPSFGITAGEVDAGNVSADYSFFEQTTDIAFSQGTLTLTFFDSGINMIGQNTSGGVDSFNQWNSASGDFAVPTGTRYIVYTENFLSTHASDANDVFIDNNFLGLTVPEPPLGLLAAGLAVTMLVFAGSKRSIG